MFWQVAEPVDAGGLEADVGVEAACDGAVDDGLLLLVEQSDQPSLRADVPPNPPVGMIEKANDRIASIARRQRQG